MSASAAGPGDAPRAERDRSGVLAELLQRRAGYVPAWTAGAGDPGLAVLDGYAAMTALLWERLDAAADKAKLAFLSELGIDSLPPAAARAPVAFEAFPGARPGSVPAGSLLGAPSPDGGQLVFRTERAIGLSPSPLADVRSVVPGRDASADHTAEALGARPFRLFEPLVALERALLIGHRELLAVSGAATISVELELSREARTELRLRWSIWNGELWREIADADVEDLTVAGSAAEPGSLRRSGTVILHTNGIESAPTAVDGVTAYWLRCQLLTPLTGTAPLHLPAVDQIRLAVTLGDPLTPVVHPVPAALALGQPADLASPFLPFGPAPDRTTILHLDATPVVTSRLPLASLRGRAEIPGDPLKVAPALLFEYWDGARWAELRPATNLGLGTTAGSHADFDLPFAVRPSWAPSEIGGTVGHWARIRLPEGGAYAGVRQVVVPDGSGGTTTLPVTVPSPPLLSGLELTVSGTSPATFADHVLVQDGALYHDRTDDSRWRGQGYLPFLANADLTPTLYLGFDGPLAPGDLGLYLEIEPPAETSGHELRWERFDGRAWVSLPVEDETAHLTVTGIVRLTWPGNRPLRRVEPAVAAGSVAETVGAGAANTFAPGDQVHVREGDQGELAVVAAVEGRSIRFTRDLAGTYRAGSLSEPEPPLFGQPRTWIRARLTEGEPPLVVVNRVVVNATWASENRTVEGEVLGSGDGQPNQRLRAARAPVLEGERVEVRELSGARARTDLALLERELAAAGRLGAHRPETGPSGQIEAVWVTWEGRPNLLSSGPGDRHYVVDRVTGTFRGGDGAAGRAFPPGRQNVIVSYATGGGTAGNVAAGAIATPLSGVVAARVWNPVAATGGADAEAADQARLRAPRILRHRYQAVTADDFADLAREASPEVLAALAVLDGDDMGGAVRVVVLPRSTATPPRVSAQLLAHVHRHLALRCPPGVARRLTVEAAPFVEIGVTVTVAGVAGAGGEVFDAVRSGLEAFLHPVVGGPAGTGWPFGPVVHVARLAPVLEATAGVDHVEDLTVTVGGAVVGDEIRLAADELPVAGPVRVTLTRAGGR